MSNEKSMNKISERIFDKILKLFAKEHENVQKKGIDLLLRYMMQEDYSKYYQKTKFKVQGHLNVLQRIYSDEKIKFNSESLNATYKRKTASYILELLQFVELEGQEVDKILSNFNFFHSVSSKCYKGLPFFRKLLER